MAKAELHESDRLALDFERIRILFDNMRFGYLGVLSSCTMIFFIAARYASLKVAGLWLLVALLSNLPRIFVSVQFARKLKAGVITQANIAPWEGYMTAGNTVAYLGFVSSIFLPYDANTEVGVALCAFAYMIMATGGVLVLCTSLVSILVFLSLVTLAIVTRFVMLQDALFILIAIIFFLGYIQLVRLIVGQNQTLAQNISLKIENKRFALIDPLTRLWNRRRLELYLAQLIPAAKRSGDTFSVILCDIDHFKQYNDSKGHAEGDSVLTQVAQVLLDCCREQDLVLRYGGEEFLVMLPQTSAHEATRIAERIRGTVKQKTDVTISAGLAESDEHCNFEHILKEADDALYQAKDAGRDRFVVAGRPTPPEQESLMPRL